MAKRPTLVPYWATDPSAQVVEPTSEKRASGFVSGERPPAQWFNWMWNVHAQWLDFLRGPSITNWTRYSLTFAAVSIAADESAQEANRLTRRLAMVSPTGASNNLATSARGDTWAIGTARDGSGAISGLRLIAFTGNYWIITNSAGKMWYTIPDDGANASAIRDPAAYTFTACTLPAGVTSINNVRVGPSGSVCAAANNGFLYSADGLTFSLVTLSDPLTGQAMDVAWTGQAWVGTTTDGKVYRATSPTGTWSLLSITLYQHLGARAYRLAADTRGTVMAYFGGAADTRYIYTSRDHGVNWTASDEPYLWTDIQNAKCLGDLWFMVSDVSPYLAQANAPDDPTWNALPIPYADPSYGVINLHDLCYAQGCFFVVGTNAVLVSLRGMDTASGDWAQTHGAIVLADAAYLQGRPIDASAPSSGDLLAWNGTDWAPLTPVGSGVTLAGDVTGAPSSTEVVAIQGRGVLSAAPNVGDALIWDGSHWAPGTGWVSNVFSKTFDLAGSTDYMASGAWTDICDPHYDGSDVSGALGDGVHMPYFYAYSRANFNQLKLQGGLYFKYGGSVIADGWPSTDRGPSVVIPLPPLMSFVIDLTVNSNMVQFPAGDPGQGQYHHCCFGVYRIMDNAATPTEVVAVYWDGTSSTTVSEKASCNGTGSATASLPSSGSGLLAAVQRRYRLVRNPNGTAVYGESTPGSGAFTLLYARGHLKRFAATHPEVLSIWQGTGNGYGASGMVATLTALTISGVRVPF